MTRIALGLLLLVLAPAAFAENPLDKLRQDSKHDKVIKGVLKKLSKYYDPKAKPQQRERALQEFLAWLPESEKAIGVDVLADPALLVEFFDQARIDPVFRKAKIVKGRVAYAGDINDKKGKRGFAYHAPKSYDPRNNDRYPTVVTLHGRAANPKHPAARGGGDKFQQRGRVALFNYWLDSPALESTIVAAPTGLPAGFDFNDKNFDRDRIALYGALNGLLEEFRTDWNRLFLEVGGTAFRWVLANPFVFTGYIVRNGQIPAERHFLFENLNGAPLLYVQDPASKGGGAIVKALKEAYDKAGAPENLVVLQGKRNAYKALVADQAAIAKFVTTHKRGAPRKQLHWRFWNGHYVAPMPITQMRANFFYDPKLPLAQTAGKLTFTVKRGEVKVGGNTVPESRIEIDITEAEQLTLFLRDDQIPLDGVVTVVVNGKVIKDKVQILRDPSLFVDTILPSRYFMFPYIQRLDVTFPLKRQVEPKKKVRPAAAGGGDAEGAAAKVDEEKGGNSGGAPEK